MYTLIFRFFYFFFFNDTATTEIYTLSLHDALPICRADRRSRGRSLWPARGPLVRHASRRRAEIRTGQARRGRGRFRPGPASAAAAARNRVAWAPPV